MDTRIPKVSIPMTAEAAMASPRREPARVRVARIPTTSARG